MLARSVFRRNFTNVPQQNQFERILIANRGEIACRVSRTAKGLGIQTVGIYSDVDQEAVHTTMCDMSFYVGPAPSKQSYLNMDRIIAIAKASGAQAIHPGYGFLSENPIFADKVNSSGLIFVGPSGEAMKKMASKAEAKKIMEIAGVPVTPGYHGEDQSIGTLKLEAEKIGFPIMIKAVMGGGGKGMRIVESAVDFDEKLSSAKRESMKHFSDDRVILEKYIRRSRHIEVQVFADKHGNTVYLYERDCSAQRRHQKILEEAPAPGLTEMQRHELGEQAVAAARAVNYVGAGTVEFLWDCDTDQFYFMEMNTRLQVEHPVTELITGVDLVQWQLEAANNINMQLSQSDISKNGHAIEARIYAENTGNNFMPDTGTLKILQLPEPSPALRVEIGLQQGTGYFQYLSQLSGDSVTVFYDPMIAKIIAYGRNRTEAISRLRQALEEMRVVGVRTNIPFLLNILGNQKFGNGPVDTSFIQEQAQNLFQVPDESNEDLAILAGFFQINAQRNIETNLFGPFIPHQQSIVISGKTICARKNSTQMEVILGDQVIPLSMSKTKRGNYFVRIGDRIYPNVTIAALSKSKYQIIYSGRNVIVDVEYEHSAKIQANTSTELSTPMPCTIHSIPVAVGQRIKKGQTVAVLEAMKMEHVLKAPSDGIVKGIFYKEGSIVAENQKLVEFEKIC